MTTISSSGTLIYNSGAFFYNGAVISFASSITINAGVTVTFGSDLTLTSTNQYFIIGGVGVTIDGAGYVVNVPANYTGLVQNGTSSPTNGFGNCLLENIGIKQTGTIYNGVAQDYFGNGNISCSITNCYANVGTVSPPNSGFYGGGIAGQHNTASISKCYVICRTLGAYSGGIAGQHNSGAISNCYVICGGGIGRSGGIACLYNSGAISNCYVICGGNIISSSGGITGLNNSGPISNCYVICGGNINAGGIVGASNISTISNCYVICCRNIQSVLPFDSAGGIAAFNNSGTISNCYVNYNTLGSSSYAIASNGTIQNCGSSPSTTPQWTTTGAAYLTSSAWTNTDPTNNTPWVLSAFDTAIASSTTATSTSGTIPLNTYGQSFANGSVYSGKKSATFTYVAGTAIAYSDIYFGTTYTLGLFAYELLSNLTSFTFAFTNDAAIRTAFNYTGSSANNIVPYSYSVTDDITLIYPIISGVCFQEKTPIQTDQGIIPIEKINSDVNTINNKKIVGITKTISQDKYLVCFEKDSLGANYPTKSTTVSKQHKILYSGKLIEANKFLCHFAGVKKVKYSGEVLYNVLMEKHEVIRANNLLCETLHPQNIIAKLYNSCMSESYKSKLTSLFNESILKNDHASYKKIVNRL